MSRSLGHVERAADGWAVFFARTLGDAPDRLPARFHSELVALSGLDLLRVWRAAREGEGLSSVPLSATTPEDYANNMEELARTPWEEMLQLLVATAAQVEAHEAGGGAAAAAAEDSLPSLISQGWQEEAQEERQRRQAQQTQQQQLEEPPPAAHTPAGGGGTKRRRRSEAERLAPFCWDRRNEIHPFNARQIKPSTARRAHKRWRGLNGAPSATALDSNAAGSARAVEQAHAPAATTTGEAALAAAAVAAAEAGEQAAAEGQAADAAAGIAAAPAAAAKEGAPGEASGGDAAARAHRDAAAAGPAQPSLAGALPLPPPALAALGFGAAWLALRCGVEAAAAAAREAELRQLLARVAALGGAAWETAERFSACFCSVLQQAQQAQHLARVRAELAPGGGGPYGVLAWLRLTLDAVGMPQG